MHKGVFKVKSTNRDTHLGGEDFDISLVNHILSKFREGSSIDQVFITVPAYFNNAQRQATEDAGQIAGIEVCHVINEPMAAVLAYGLDRAEPSVIAVYNLGGGTFDIPSWRCIRESSRSSQLMETPALVARTSTSLVNHILNEVREGSSIDLGHNCMAIQRICKATEKAKDRAVGYNPDR
ncbi:hypothetical protein PISMIDRAFT_14127 [Pisolithus microcarpus 441]|uniref:Uncharacterized protein n=1 Tax=Pisolithus microcarpus 441 TaxID=765257 RepID=A0A0C9Z8L3_9AGAM|nr:hypothetical protein PISMIDRAFT_14127 [Pisolithus microcarpus 441]